MANIYKWLAAAAGLLVVGFLVWYFHTIVFYILISAVLSLMGKPLVTMLEKLKLRGWSLPKWLAAMITLLVIGSIITGVVLVLLPVIVEKIEFISSYNIKDLNAMLTEPIARIENYINYYFPQLQISIPELMEQQLAPIFNSGFVQRTIGSVTTFLVDMFIAVFSISFITFFFLKEEHLFNEGLVILFPKQYEGNILRAINSITTLLVRYFIGICIESLIKLVCVAVPLYLFGFEISTALLIGLITAVLNVIPYIGPIIGGLIAFLIAAITPVEGVSLTAMIFQVGGVLMIFQLLDNIILQPYIYSSSVKAHPLEIFIVILMAGYIAGITGMLFAIPAYTVLRVFAKEFFNNFRVVQRLTEKI